jgi:hypothetical protein
MAIIKNKKISSHKAVEKRETYTIGGNIINAHRKQYGASLKD